MIATADNTLRVCDRCGKLRTWVMYSAFQRDGSATFRKLCKPCELAEKQLNQPALFEGAPVHAETQPQPETIERPTVDDRQMTMF